MNAPSSQANPWQLARRAERMNPSVIREILKVTERPGVLSLAGGLPSPEGFPVEAMREATARVLRDHPREALQYASSEGFAPLREWVAAEMATQGLRVHSDQVLITTGSQQGLDLVGKVLIDAGSGVPSNPPPTSAPCRLSCHTNQKWSPLPVTTTVRCRRRSRSPKARAFSTPSPTSKTRAAGA